MARAGWLWEKAAEPRRAKCGRAYRRSTAAAAAGGTDGPDAAAAKRGAPCRAERPAVPACVRAAGKNLPAAVIRALCFRTVLSPYPEADMRHPIVVRHSLVLLVALLSAPQARAQVRIEGQERRVEVGVWVYDERTEETVLLGSGDAEAVAPDAGPFDRALEVRVDAFPPPEANVSKGIASQFSTIAPGRFHGSGRVEVYAESDEGMSRGL